MDKIREIFDPENERFAAVRETAKEATGACQDAARGLDTLQERVLIEFGMPSTATFIHNMAHEFPPFFDKIGDILHQRHIAQDYPATAEYTETPEDLDSVFKCVVEILEKVASTLRRCVEVADQNGLHPLGRQFETLEIQNSERYEKVLYAWRMYERNEVSATSFENWMKHLNEDGD